MEARARRALASVGLAAAMVATVGMLYLRPWHAFAPTPTPKPTGLPATVSATVEEMQFLSAELGWVVAGDPVSARLLRTTDGGRHWQRQLSGVQGQNWTLSFFDARRGVVSGTDKRGTAELWRTADGGQTWTSRAMPGLESAALVSFVDPDHGWCLVPASGPSLGTGPIPDRQEVAVYRTVDGGVHWTRLLVTAAPARPVNGGLSDQGLKAWIWFRDQHVGWIGQNSMGDHAVMYATADGGDSWSREEVPPPSNGWGQTAAMIEQGPDEPGGRSSPWFEVSSMLPGPVPGSIVQASTYVYFWQPPTWTGPVVSPGTASIMVVGGTRWLAASGPLVLESSDAGVDWQSLGQAPAGWAVTRLQMVDSNHGWALLFTAAKGTWGVQFPSMLARSADGGRHWVPVAVQA